MIEKLKLMVSVRVSGRNLVVASVTGGFGNRVLHEGDGVVT